MKRVDKFALLFLFMLSTAAECGVNQQENLPMAAASAHSGESFIGNIKHPWETSSNSDLYVPVITWHNRYFYNDEHVRRYNERPWGAGYGRSRLDNAQNWHAIYFMIFKDSFNQLEPFTGYAWEARWRPFAGKDISVGAGFTAGLTARDNWHYLPMPAVLPLASISYRQLALQGTYIPGTRNNGNVLFAWLKWRIPS